MTYTLAVRLNQPYAAAVEAVRAALADQGFGVLTEIDLSATLSSKLGVDVEPQVILGACRPVLAHQALRADPSIAVLLPCNVVVRAVDETTTLVEALDPETMMSLAGSGVADALAADAKERLTAALHSLEQDTARPL